MPSIASRGAGPLVEFLRPLLRLFGFDPQKAEQNAWLRKIAVDPENRPLRLAYADWLVAGGDPLGEFIRIDDELEDMGPDDERRKPLDDRWSRLAEEHAKRWLEPLKRLGLEPLIAGRFYPHIWMRHGIVEEVSIDLPGILPEQADRLFDAAPALRKIALQSTRVVSTPNGTEFIEFYPDFPTIAGLPHLEQIRSLELASQHALTAEDVRSLASSPYLRNLTELDLGYNNELGPEAGGCPGRVADLDRLERPRPPELLVGRRRGQGPGRFGQLRPAHPVESGGERDRHRRDAGAGGLPTFEGPPRVGRLRERGRPGGDGPWRSRPTSPR